jgi:predicted nuclease of predicted toxin-antitoxin system
VRWLADECVAGVIVARLRATGHDVAYTAEISPAASDTHAIAYAHRESRLLLTEDKDFGELVFRWNWPVPGLVLLRIDPEKNLLK